MVEQLKRNIAYKLKIGTILNGSPVMEGEKLKSLICNEKNTIRVNIIANVIDKFIQEGEKKFGSITLDDASGQIKIKSFGDDVDKLNLFKQGDTLMVIGLIRMWNKEIYINPEIMKKKDSSYLLIRKLEAELEQPKTYDKERLLQLKDKITILIKEGDKDGGIDIEKIILELKEQPDTINKEIKKLLEDGVAYEPRPGKLRWLG